MKKFAVIGLGRFGMGVALTLAEKGQEVIAIDKAEDLVQNIMEYVTKAVCLDSTDERAMKSIGIENVDIAVCAIGTDMEASILVTLLLKELGVETIVCKGISAAHKIVLEKIGASKVVMPENDMGARVANTLISKDDNILDHIELPGNASLIEFVPQEEFIGKTLREINIRANYGVNIIAIKKQTRDPHSGLVTGSDDINISPIADDVVGTNDVLVVFGESEKIDNLKRRG